MTTMITRRDRHRVLLERLDQVEADDRDHDLHGHHHEPDCVLRAGAAGWSPISSKHAEHEVEHDPGVDADPAHRHQQLRDAGR